MRVAICDDISKELKKISDALENYSKAHPELYFEIDRYGTAIDMLCETEKDKIFDIALLDICMPGMLGTDVAKEILLRSPDTGIIFLTTSPEYAVEAFALNAVHYLLKPFTQKQFDDAMDRTIQKIEEKNFIALHCTDGMYRVELSKIIFMESQGHYLAVHLASGESLRLRRPLSQMYEEIKEYSEFARVGASFIINFNFVRKFSSGVVETTSGVKISVPRRSSEEVRKAYMDFCRKEALK